MLAATAKKLLAYFSFNNLKKIPYLRTTIAIILLIITLVTLPEALLYHSIDKKKLKQQISGYFDKIDLPINYDDLEFSFFRGMILYQFTIFDKSNSRKIKFSIPQLVIKVNWFRYLQENIIEIHKIHGKHSLWNLHFNTQDDFYRVDENLLGKISKQYEGINFEFRDSIINIKIEEGTYRKTQFQILNNKIEFNNDNQQFSLNVKYRDPYLGSGELELEPFPCQTKSKIKNKAKPKVKLKETSCSVFYGKFTLNFDKLPANKLAWFVPSLEVKNGKLKGEASLIPNKNTIIFKTRFRSDSISLNYLQKRKNQLSHRRTSLFVNLPLRMALELNPTDKKIDLKMKGKLDEFPFLFSIEQKPKETWPSTLFVEIKKPARDASLPLTSGFNINGLQAFRLQLSDSKRDIPYRKINLTLKLKNSQLMQNEQKLLEIKDLSLTCVKNKCESNSSLLYNKSNFHFDFKAEVASKKDVYWPIKELYEGTRAEFRKIRIISYKIRGFGNLTFDNISYTDLAQLAMCTRAYWTNSIKTDPTPKFYESNFFERRFYHLFFKDTYVKLNLKLNNIELENNLTNLEGNLDFGFPSIKLSLKDKETKNKLEIESLYAGRSPLFYVKSDFNFVNSPNVISALIDNELISKAQSMKIHYYLYTKGDRATSLNHYWKSKSIMKLADVIFSKKADSILKNKSWSSVKLNVDVANNKERYYSILAKDDGRKFIGKASIRKYSNKPNKYSFKIKEKIK